MATNHTLTMDDVTPEFIIGAAEAAGLRLIPGRYLTVDNKGKVTGCCAAGALAIDLEPRLLKRRQGFYRTLKEMIELDALSGLIAGFDGGSVEKCYSKDPRLFAEGHAIGRATRQAAGIDGPDKKEH